MQEITQQIGLVSDIYWESWESKEKAQLRIKIRDGATCEFVKTLKIKIISIICAIKI